MPQLIPIAIALASAAYAKYTQYKAQQAQKKAQKTAKARSQAGSEIKANTRSTEEPLKVIYGQHRVGGNIVYMTSNGNKHQYLYMAMSIGEGEIEGLVNNESSKPYVWFDGELRSGEKENLSHYELLTGTGSQTCPSIISSYTDFTDNMRHTAWITWVLEYSAEVWQGIPEINMLVKGRKLYDLRTSTTAWSDNPAIALYDYLTNERYGCGIDPEQIDTQSFEDAADYCDIKNFKINMVVNIGSDDVWDTVEDIMSLFRGYINYWNGKYYLRFKDLNEEASMFTIEDEHILLDSSGKAMISLSDPGYYDTPKTIRVGFINAENNNYNDDSFIIGEENGLTVDASFYGCTDKTHAGVLGLYELERRQLTRSVAGRFRDDLITAEPGNVVTLNSSALGISNQLMRVISTTISNQGFIDLAMEYEDLTLYDDTYNLNADSIYTADYPNPNSISLIENAEVTEDIYNYRLTTYSRLNVTFDVPETEVWFKSCEIYVALDTDSPSGYVHQFNAATSFSIDPVEEGRTYFIKLRTVNLWGVRQDLNSCTKLQKLVEGKSNTPPPSLPYLLATPGDGGVSLRSEKINDPDIEVYEFRYGSQWTGGVLLSAKRAPYEELGLVKPGSHTFWANTRGTNGLYGDDPQSADITVNVPKGWSSYTTFTDDFNDADDDYRNTAHYTYNSADWLKCSHSEAYSNPLSGCYISEQFDTGVTAGTYFIYLDTETTTIGAGTTWSDVLSGGNATWDQIQVNIRKWKEIFEIEEAPQLYIRLWFKAEAAHDWSYVESAQVLAGVVFGRYFKVQITIIDPTFATNLIVKEYTLRLYN